MNKKLVSILGILFVVGVTGYVGVVIYNLFFTKNHGLSLSPEMKEAQQEVMANCKYDVDFCKYAANGIVAMSGGYTMTSESTYEGKKTKMILKSDGKENSQSTTFTEGKEQGSFITLNNITYMKPQGETVWTEFPATKDETGKPSTNLFDFESLKKELGNVSKEVEDTLVVKKIGKEACGKLQCIIFEMNEVSFGSKTKIWVDTKDYLARKMELSTSKEGVSTMTFEYGPVTISKPSPVKKMPVFDTSAIQSGSDINMEEIKKMMKDIPQTGNEEQPAE